MPCLLGGNRILNRSYTENNVIFRVAKMKAFRNGLALAAALVSLGACASLKPVGEAIGVVPSQEQQEINAVNARLSLPPDYNLRPPQSGSGVAQARAATSRGRTAVLGDKRQTTSKTETIRQANRSAGESALLKHASGNQNVERNIRTVVDNETTGSAEAEEQFTDKLLKWRPAPGDAQPAEDGESRPADATDANTPVVTKK